MENKLRWGVLSTARIGAKAVIPAIQQSRNGVVTAIASRELQSAQRAAQALGIPHAFGSYEDLLASDQVDAVYNPLPNHLHMEWTVRAAEQGKHVLCEKPMALNAAQVDEMMAAARRQRVLLMEAFMYRFHPQYSMLQSLLSSGRVGQLQMIRSAFTFRLDDPSNIRMHAEWGGGGLMDVGCYCVNMSRLVAGAEPLRVQADAVISEKTRVDVSFAAVLHFPGDVIGMFDCGFRTAYREWLSVAGSEGRLDVVRPIKPGAGPAEILLVHADDRVETFTAPAANHYGVMVESFADAVLRGEPAPLPPEDARANMRVIDALVESARSGRAVEVASARGAGDE